MALETETDLKQNTADTEKKLTETMHKRLKHY